ncbi:hypothetical protein CSUI_004206 [Cystoisospora suis]|uniref:Uncharacterized protein n=1 Tax=Cystoisospora suis TaxID=483139 RepID=A0A2C6L2K0_9APIC|nr:hypothetical protein CSUI_004206 [Cystoisospora suis]
MGMDLIIDCGQPSFVIVFGNPGCTLKRARSCGLSALQANDNGDVTDHQRGVPRKELVCVISRQTRRLLNRSSTNGLTPFSKGSHKKVVLLLHFRDLLL